MILQVYVVLRRHYPGFERLLCSVPDHRERHSYQVAELLMAGLAMFIFRRRSRNSMDNGVTGEFEANYVRLFGMRLPLTETVDKFLRKLPPEEMERLQKMLVQKLIERKVLDKWKHKGAYLVSVDGTGLSSYDYEPFEGCPHKTSKKGKKTWQAYVVEAKIVCGNGLAIPLASEWLANSEDISEGQKQDCEQKAFVRLARKLKSMYPRLPVILLADGLYPNKSSMNICRQYGWHYIFVLKDGSLKSVWEEVKLLYPLEKAANMQQKCLGKRKGVWRYSSMMFINGITYKGHRLQWIEYSEYNAGGQVDKYFAHITDMKVDKGNVWETGRCARMRWTIENQGFNTQKNGGYALGHKYSRAHLWAMKNYYHLLQIAHMVNQLTEKLKKVQLAIRQAGVTLQAIVEDVMATMKKQDVDESQLREALDENRQLRY